MKRIDEELGSKLPNKLKIAASCPCRAGRRKYDDGERQRGPQTRTLDLQRRCKTQEHGQLLLISQPPLRASSVATSSRGTGWSGPYIGSLSGGPGAAQCLGNTNDALAYLSGVRTAPTAVVEDA